MIGALAARNNLRVKNARQPADVRSEDVNTRRRCFPLSLKLDTVLKNSNRWKIQAAPTLDELSED